MNAGQIYRESAVHSSSSVGLVLTMYDMLIADLNRAIEAVRSGDVEARTREVKHALEVVGHLHASINFEEGGETANSLDTFYAIIRAKLLQAQIQQSIPLFQQQIDLVASVREAWRELETRGATAPSSPYEETAMPPPTPDGDVSHMSNWRA